MKKALLTLYLFRALGCLTLYAQQTDIYPTNWWTGMKMNHVQLLIRSENKALSGQKIEINYPGIRLLNIHHFDNPKYTAIVISAAAKPGLVKISFKEEAKISTIIWPLLAKPSGNGTSYAQGVTSGDFIDLLLTDRFSNGDSTNDKIPGMRDQSLNRDSMYLRHGGDFKGILNHIDYFKSLGVTTLWLTPVMENDMPNRTEHGYAITDHYKIDPRYGGEAMYKRLSDT